MLVEELKESIEDVLKELEYHPIDKLEDFPKLKRIYQNVYPLDNIEVNFCLTKDGDRNVMEIIAFHDNDDGTREICRCYEGYVEIIMEMKNGEFDLKVFINYIIERIKKSFEGCNK